MSALHPSNTATPALGSMSALMDEVICVDHVALAVPDLDQAVKWYRDVLGMTFVEERVTEGETTGMRSAVLQGGAIVMVLVQGTCPQSQVSRFIEKFGPGVQHIALRVSNLPRAVERLKKRGVEFSTSLIEGDGIRQIFSCREPHSGMMYEFVERSAEDARFSDANVQQMFRELEANDAF